VAIKRKMNVHRSTLDLDIHQEKSISVDWRDTMKS